MAELVLKGVTCLKHPTASILVLATSIVLVQTARVYPRSIDTRTLSTNKPTILERVEHKVVALESRFQPLIERKSSISVTRPVDIFPTTRGIDSTTSPDKELPKLSTTESHDFPTTTTTQSNMSKDHGCIRVSFLVILVILAFLVLNCLCWLAYHYIYGNAARKHIAVRNNTSNTGRKSMGRKSVSGSHKFLEPARGTVNTGASVFSARSELPIQAPKKLNYPTSGASDYSDNSNNNMDDDDRSRAVTPRSPGLRQESKSGGPRSGRTYSHPTASLAFKS